MLSELLTLIALLTDWMNLWPSRSLTGTYSHYLWWCHPTAIIHCNCFSSLWRFARIALLIVTLFVQLWLWHMNAAEEENHHPLISASARWSLLLKLLLCSSLAICCSILSVPPTNINLKNKSQSEQNFTIHLFWISSCKHLCASCTSNFPTWSSCILLEFWEMVWMQREGSWGVL